MQTFVKSGLYRPEKHHTVEKYTIPKAIASALQARNSSAQSGSSQSAEHQPLLAASYVQISLVPPPTRDYVALGMVKGKPYVLTSFGGVGKTQLAIQLACEITRGGQFADECLKQGSVLSIHSEDDIAEIRRRAGAWAATAKYDDVSIAAIHDRWQAHGLLGVDARLTAGINRELQQTVFVQRIIDTANAQVFEADEVRLIILDHAGLMHGGDFNDKADVSLFMRLITLIADQTGAAVLLLAHCPKSAESSEESAVSAIAGSTAFVDMARGAFVLATMRKNEAKEYGYNDDTRKVFTSLVTVKNNLGPSGNAIWFRRTSVLNWQVGVLEHVALTVPIKQVKGGAMTQQLIKDFVKTHPGQYSKTGLRDAQSGKDGIFKASKGEVEGALGELLANGVVILREPTKPEQEKFGHRQATKVMEIKS